MITIDSSGVLALLNRRDTDHARARKVFEEDTGPHFVPSGILAEAAYMVDRRLGAHVLELFLEDLEVGPFTIDCGNDDLPRIRYLVRRYANLPLGFADAAVVACAERHGGLILGLDVRDFQIVSRECKIALVPGF
jgi:uncharacterized protein